MKEEQQLVVSNPDDFSAVLITAMQKLCRKKSAQDEIDALTTAWIQLDGGISLRLFHGDGTMFRRAVVEAGKMESKPELCEELKYQQILTQASLLNSTFKRAFEKVNS